MHKIHFFFHNIICVLCTLMLSTRLPAKPSSAPLTVQAKKRLHCNQETGMCTAEGDVVIVQDGLSIKAPQAALSFAPSSPRAIKTLRAWGTSDNPVTLTKGIAKLQGRILTYHQKTGKITMKGAPIFTTKDLCVKTSSPFFFNLITKKGYTLKPVVIFFADRAALSCEKLIYDCSTSPLKSSTIRLHFHDNVLLTNKKTHIKSDLGTYNGPKQAIWLRGHVVVNDNKHALVAENVRYDLATDCTHAFPQKAQSVVSLACITPTEIS